MDGREAVVVVVVGQRLALAAGAQVGGGLLDEVAHQVVAHLDAAGVGVVERGAASQRIVFDAGFVALGVDDLGDLFQRVVGIARGDGLTGVEFGDGGDQVVDVFVGFFDARFGVDDARLLAGGLAVGTYFEIYRDRPYLFQCENWPRASLGFHFTRATFAIERFSN